MKKLFFLTAILLSNFLNAQTPQLVKDINPGRGSVGNSASIILNGKLVFNLNASFASSTYGHNQLWITDGTDTGTIMLRAFKLGSDVRNFAVMNGKLYFIADDSIHGREPWVTDGTVTGTHLLKDINPTPLASSIPGYFASKYITYMNNHIYFPADDGIHGIEIWTSDGSPAGTQMLRDINPDSSCIDTLYYRSAGESNSNAVVLNKYFFAANDGPDADELWVTDGTASGTKMLKISTATIPGSYPSCFMPYNNKLYLAVYDNDTTSGLWVSDGTSVGTQLISNKIVPIYWDNIVMDGNLYFTARHGSNIGLIKTDGTNSGTMILLDSISNSGFSVSADNNETRLICLTQLDHKLYFANGNSLWQSDGTPSGTRAIYTSPNSPPLTELRAINNRLFFKTYTLVPPQNSELFISDGTDTGTRQIKYPGENYFSALFNLRTNTTWSPVAAVGNTVYFFNGYDTSVGIELYKIELPLGVSNIISKGNKIEMWPNPANLTLYLSINGEGTARENERLNIVNTLGQMVLSKSYQRNKQLQIDVHDLASGVYFVQLNGEYAGKFVKY